MRDFPITGQEMLNLGLGGLFKWAGRSAQIEALIKMVQEGCHAFLEAVVEKKKARGQDDHGEKQGTP